MYNMMNMDMLLCMQILLLVLFIIVVLITALLIRSTKRYIEKVSDKCFGLEKYKSRFMQRAKGKTTEGKIAYLRKDQHQILSDIVRFHPEKKISIYSLLENIVEEHLTVYAKEIRELTAVRNEDQENK